MFFFWWFCTEEGHGGCVSQQSPCVSSLGWTRCITQRLFLNRKSNGWRILCQLIRPVNRNDCLKKKGPHFKSSALFQEGSAPKLIQGWIYRGRFAEIHYIGLQICTLTGRILRIYPQWQFPGAKLKELARPKRDFARTMESSFKQISRRNVGQSVWS